MAKEVWTEKESIADAKVVHASQMLFPIGESNDGFAQYFIGQSYLAPVFGSQVGIFNVTFEQGCRNNWYIHHADEGGGQILICLAWCRTAPHSWFSHLAVEVPEVNTFNEWLEPVTEEVYSLLK